MSALNLVRLEVDPSALAAYAVAEDISDGDNGYAVHTALRRRYGSAGPQPFRLLEAGGPTTLLGYAVAADALAEAAALPAIDPRLEHIFPRPPQCRPMPATWRNGQPLAFEVRTKPVVRYGGRARSARATAGRVGAGERDAFLAAIEDLPADQHVDRETVYRQWLERTLGEAVTLSGVRVTAMRRLRLRRSRHAGGRAALLEGYEVVFKGELTVGDPAYFAQLLARGVGRHTAFGFGMLLLRPPGKP